MGDKPAIRLEEITHLSVVNDNDPAGNQRALTITVNAHWWAEANNAAKQMIWHGLITSAEAKWSAEDAIQAQVQADAAAVLIKTQDEAADHSEAKKEASQIDG